MAYSSTGRLVLGTGDGSIDDTLSINSSANFSARPPKRRSWLRLDATEEDDSVLSVATEQTHEAYSHVISHFPDPPSTYNMDDAGHYQDNCPSSSGSTQSDRDTTPAHTAARGSQSSAITSDAGDRDREREVELARKRQEQERERERVRERLARSSRGKEMEKEGIPDFFGPEVYQIVLRNPTTAHRLLKFCQSRACGENMEFLEKVGKYNRLLDELSKLLGEIHTEYTSVNAPSQINISGSLSRRITSNIRGTTQQTIPAMEEIFLDAQEQIENLLATDIYPRFVKHQVTTAAALALTDDKSRYQGLGDCFCVTDPSIADNPILYASDGFVEVTGYDRRDIVPRNCRFLQGAHTDRQATKRLRYSIDNADETVELLLNYRKNGDPFWNLLYVSPLYDQDGKVVLFLGGQINCSTTVHSCTDVLKILSLNDGDLEPRPSLNEGRPVPGSKGEEPSLKSRTSFFKSWKRQARGDQAKADAVKLQAGMEGDLIDKMGRFNFKTQVEAFYTAYSKYLVMSYSPSNGNLNITHYSPTAIDLLCLHGATSSVAHIFSKDVFSVFTTHQLAPDTKAYRAAKSSVKEAIRNGKAISVEMALLTGIEVKRAGVTGLLNTLNLGGTEKAKKMEWTRKEERFVTHWTPLKDENSTVKYVVLTVAPK